MITRKEHKRFLELKEKLFGKEKFVVMDESDPEVREYNDLGIKLMATRVKQMMG